MVRVGASDAISFAPRFPATVLRDQQHLDNALPFAAADVAATPATSVSSGAMISTPPVPGRLP